MRVWNVMITGGNFEYLLCMLFTPSREMAMELAQEEFDEMNYESYYGFRVEPTTIVPHKEYR